MTVSLSLSSIRRMDLGLAGKRAIVTGGSRGIGKQVARGLIAEGARVALVARGEAQLAAAAAELGPEAFPIQCDTGSDPSVKAMIAAAVGRLGGIDILVNGAAQAGGQAPPPRLAEISTDAFWGDINVKVMGYLRCIREAVSHMPDGGRIINISGLAARSTGSTIGSVRNVGVAALTKNIADELGPRGISVVVVHPALTRTEKTAAVIEARAKATSVSTDDIERQLAAGNVLNRIIDAAEVADVIVFLCSQRAIAVNGDSVVVGGGIPGSIHY